MLNFFKGRNAYNYGETGYIASPVIKRTCISKYHKVDMDGHRTLANGSIVVRVLEAKPKTSKRR